MSERLPWFRCTPSALLGALAGMQPDEGYVYTIILMRIYETGGPVAETSRSLSRRTGLLEGRVRRALAGLIESGKVISENRRLDSPTTHAELTWQRERREEQIKAGKSSAKTRALKPEQNQQNPSTPVQRPLNHIDRDIDKERKKKEGEAPPKVIELKKYVFEGEVIKLTMADFKRWEQTYQNLVLRASLEEIDAFYVSSRNTKGNDGWFHRTANMLEKKNLEAALRVRLKPGFRLWNGM